MEEPTYVKNMRELRKQAHYTQEEVSEKLNIQRQTYSNYENEWRQPPLDIIIRLADLYHVSIDYLLRGTESELTADAASDDVSDLFPCPFTDHISDAAVENVCGISSGNISDGSPGSCEHLSEATHRLLHDFFSLSEEEQTEAWEFIQKAEVHSPDHIFP